MNNQIIIFVMRRYIVSFILLAVCMYSYAQNNNKESQLAVISEENYEGYRMESYSDKTSKIIDKQGNWIHFYTEYDKNEYTGEVTTKPIKIQKILSADFEKKGLPMTKFWVDIFEADIKNEKGYHLQMEKGLIKIKTPKGYSICIDNFSVLHESYPFTKDKFKKEEGFIRVYGITRNGYIPRFITKAFIQNDIKTLLTKFVREAEGDIDFYSDDLGKLDFNYYLKGKNGKLLRKLKNAKFKVFPNDYQRESSLQIEECYYEDLTHRIILPECLSSEERFYQLVSLKSDINNLSLNESPNTSGTYIIRCWPNDTITSFNCTDNIVEIGYSNGDYLKYSFLKRIVYDCQLHRSDGIFSIKIEDNKPIARFKYTSGEYKGYTYIQEDEAKIQEDYTLNRVLSSNNKLIYPEYGSVFYDSKTKKRLKYDSGSLYDVEGKTYAYLGGRMKQEMKEKEEAKQRKEKEYQPLYQKYGKKYVDAIRNNNKILVGTPEGLIVNHLNSSLIRESQYSRMYRIGGLMGGRAATVTVDKKTKKVSSVTY